MEGGGGGLALKMKQEADSLLQFALRYTGGVYEFHTYGRELLLKKRVDEAVKVFKLNASKHPDFWVTQLGLARAYGAQSDFKTALKYAYAAKKMIPKKETEMGKGSVYYLIDQLEKKQIPIVFLAPRMTQDY